MQWNMLLTALWTLIKILIIVVPLMVCVAYLTYAERKVIGFMQGRIGPNRVGYRGLLQPIADAVKLLFKEIIIPSGANKSLFLLGPILAIAPALAAWAVIPFAETLVLANINAGLLYIMAISSMGVYGVIVAGWASNSKYAFLGAMRSAAQMVSYEIAMGFALVGVLMAAQSLNLTDIVRGQVGGIQQWYVWPLFVVYFIAGVAETNRAPFDVVEGEAEIVAGHMIEYSGMAFALFFLSEYANMILISTLTSIMFLGGWLAPVSFSLVGMKTPEWIVQSMWFWNWFWLFAKTFVIATMFLWVRATFPRFRYDQIMRLGWKIFIPVTLVWLVVVWFLAKTYVARTAPVAA